MSLHYLLHSGKNCKFTYYLKNAFRIAEPKLFLRVRLAPLLRKAKKRKDFGYMQERVSYYNKLSTPVELPADAPLLAGHTFRKQSRKGVYFYDTYEYTRFFPDSRKWYYLSGDIIHIPERPTIVKSRPIEGDNTNSVLLNLDKIRHFTFVNDKIPYTEKMDKIIFRGKVGKKLARRKFMEMYLGHPMCDVGDVSRDAPHEWKTPKKTIPDHLKYKFIMALEGNDVASNLKWVMSSNSIAVMPRPTYETWFMEGKLIPNYHYIEIKTDFSDLEERVKYYMAHPEEAQQIIRHANEYVSQFRNRKREKLISLMVLNKYFEKTC